MIFKNDFIKSEVGYVYQNENILICFGQKNFSIESDKNNFAQIHFQKIKQTHSDLIVESSDNLVEADAHYTSQPQTGLLISTADCLPVMIYCPQTKRVAAIHAGWKGVVNQIVYKSLLRLIQTGSSNKKFQIWVGPHILKQSFEVDLDVFLQLEKAGFNLNKENFYSQKNNKYFIELNVIVESQIKSISSDSNIYYLNIDTMSDTDFWSFRRDKASAGRNLSFIAML